MQESVRLDAFAPQWLAECRLRLKPRTVARYESTLRVHILPAFGHLALVDLTRAMIRTFLVAMQVEKKREPGTARAALAVLRACLTSAQDAELLTHNPARCLVRVTKTRRDVKRHDVMSPEQVTTFLRVACVETPALYPIFLTMARTGCRIGECLGLRWTDLDFTTRQIHIRRTCSQGKLGTTKSGEERTVDMSRGLADVLADLPRRSAFVFPGPFGTKPWSSRAVQDNVKWLAEAAGLRGNYSTHGFRHYWASTQVARGESVAWIAQALGHRDATLVTGLYGRHYPVRNLRAVDALD